MQKTYKLEELADVARKGDVWTRRALANSSQIPAGVLDILANDPDADTRMAVARNPTCSGRLLTQLAHDPDINVRCEVARSSKTPATTLVALARDDAAHVRGEVASNWMRTPRAIIEQLLDDPNIMVQSRARAVLHWAETPMPKSSQARDTAPDLGD